MSGNKNTIIAFNYFGGKFTWLKDIYDHFPLEYNHLVDTFSGSMVVSLNAPGRIIRTANDINDDIVNFFRVLRDHTEELIRRLELTPCAKSEYDMCWESTDDNIERARRFYVRVRQSFFGLGAQRKNKGWHCAKQHVNAQGGEVVSRWNNSFSKLMIVAEELRKNFQVTNYEALTVIDKLDTPKTFFYIDYPYDETTRQSQNDYKHEINDEYRIKLSEKLHAIKGMAMVSGYPGGLTEELYKDWNMIKFKPKGNNIRNSFRKREGQTKVQECIWINYPLSRTRKSQLQLFENENTLTTKL